MIAPAPRSAAAILTLSSTLLAAPRAAEACGCFAPPDPTVPVVQAGERIVFAHRDGRVVAHIQIQYQGEAAEFGWLLPLPSVPTLKLGTEELFTQLVATTQPRYRLNRVFGEQCTQVPTAGGSRDAGAVDAGASEDGAGSPVVLEDSIGPYDFAVLRADDREEMFEWLRANRYFIPTGTDDAVGPYIRPGAYFLALKLRSGNSAGDIQPVVVEYPSDLPMIPIILTSVAAVPDMGVQVWVLGDARAIPRNYRHTVLDEQRLDWFDGATNYVEEVVRATNEAPDGQSFITEYAGSTQRMIGLLDGDGRFPDRSALEAIDDPFLLAQAIAQGGFQAASSFRSIVARAYPYPEQLRAQGIDEDRFYGNLGWYLGSYRARNPALFEGYLPSFDRAALIVELWERIVTPTVEAGRLFREHPVMTRLFTTLSPEEMTRDPVFSFNPELPMVDNEHVATFEVACPDGRPSSAGVLVLPDGRRIEVASPSTWRALSEGRPSSARIEILREEGEPIVEVDNLARSSSTDGSSCVCAAPSPSTGVDFGLLVLALGVLAARRSLRPR